MQASIDLIHGGHVKITKGYSRSSKLFWFNDDRCDHDPWLASPNKVKRGTGCPICKNTGKTAEMIISEIRKAVPYVYFEAEFSPQFLGQMRYDAFFVFENHIQVAFEYDGEFHFQPHWERKLLTEDEKIKHMKIVKDRDSRKNALSEEHNIHMIRLDYMTYQNDPINSVDVVIQKILKLATSE